MTLEQFLEKIRDEINAIIKKIGDGLISQEDGEQQIDDVVYDSMEALLSGEYIDE
jgi:hypothetical protein